MPDTLILARNWAVNTLTSILDICCQIYPLVSKAPEWCWERSEQVFRPCNNCLRVGWKAGSLGDKWLFSERGCCSLVYAFWPGHYPLGTREIQPWVTFSVRSQCAHIYIYISFRGIDFPGAEAKSAAQIFEEKIWKLWRPTFLLMNRVCSCLYQVSSLIFCPFPPVFFLIPLCFWCSLECFKDVNYMVLSTSRMRYFCHVSLRSLNPLYHTWNFPFFTYI